MKQPTDFSFLTTRLGKAGIKKKVALACPHDDHTLGGRSRHAAHVARVDGLVACAVRHLLLPRPLALHIRRDGRVAERVEQFVQRAFGDEGARPHAAADLPPQFDAELAVRAEHGDLPFPGGPATVSRPHTSSTT